MLKTLEIWVLLTCSAGMYSLPFIAPLYFWWLILFFPLPLFYLAIQQKIGFKESLYWAALSSSLHLWGILVATKQLAEGNVLYCIVPALLIVAYAGLLGILILGLGSKLITKIVNKHTIITLVLWSLLLWAYFYFIDTAVLVFAWVHEGYALMNPLLPLVQCPVLLNLLPVVGSKIVLFLLFFSAAAVTYAYVSKNFIVKIVAIFIALAPLLLSLAQQNKISGAPNWLAHTTILPVRFKVPLESVGIALKKQLERVISLFPDTELIILPEGAVHPHALEQLKPQCFTWDSNKSINVLVGGTSWHDTKRYNTIYWLYNGCLKTWYYKRHAMLLIEYLAPGIDYPLMQKLYFNKLVPLSVSDNQHPLWELFPEVKLTPYICSELFFNQKPDDAYTEPIMAFCGDHWCSSAYIRNLMYMSARFKAIEWQRDILYISYFYAHYCTKEGGTFAVNRLDNNFIQNN